MASAQRVLLQLPAAAAGGGPAGALAAGACAAGAKQRRRAVFTADDTNVSSHQDTRTPPRVRQHTLPARQPRLHCHHHHHHKRHHFLLVTAPSSTIRKPLRLKCQARTSRSAAAATAGPRRSRRRRHRHRRRRPFRCALGRQQQRQRRPTAPPTPSPHAARTMKTLAAAALLGAAACTTGFTQAPPMSRRGTEGRAGPDAGRDSKRGVAVRGHSRRPAFSASLPSLPRDNAPPHS